MRKSIKISDHMTLEMVGDYVTRGAPYVTIYLRELVPEQATGYEDQYQTQVSEFEFPHHARSGGGWSGQMAALQRAVSDHLSGRPLPAGASGPELMSEIERYCPAAID